MTTMISSVRLVGGMFLVLLLLSLCSTALGLSTADATSSAALNRKQQELEQEEGASAEGEQVCVDNVCYDSSSSRSVPLEQVAQDVMDWIRSEDCRGGFVSSQVELKHLADQGRWGLFATADLGTSEMVLEVSSQCMLLSTIAGAKEKDAATCSLMKALMQEQAKSSTSNGTVAETAAAESSRFESYLQLVQASFAVPNKKTLPPRLWSNKNKELLQQLLETTNDAQQPETCDIAAAATTALSKEDQARYQDAFEWWAAQHGRPWSKKSDGGNRRRALIPIYDLMHQNVSSAPNTRVLLLDNEDETRLRISTIQPVSAGQELLTSFLATDRTVMIVDPKKRARGIPTTAETSLLFQEYGLVLDLPQTWTYSGTPRVSFVLDHKRIGHKEANELQVVWVNEPAEKERQAVLKWVRAELERLNRLNVPALLEAQNSDDDDTAAITAAWQVQQLHTYYKALVTSLQSMLELFDGTGWCDEGRELRDEDFERYKAAREALEEDEDDEVDVKVKPATSLTPSPVKCLVPATRYSALNQVYDDYHRQACDEQAEVNHIAENFDEVDYISSPYQEISYHADTAPGSDNVCFELDRIFQICTSYRPHYHEMVVHYPARFLPPNSIRRVLWVGGGDSMLLHEILKYSSSSLELAVGLELDQQVTRGAFLHYGVQPHWDLNQPKGKNKGGQAQVQWWYGDASKTLLMLPAEWFGTFDMVLVDLSETVMSMTVTEGLDILTALSLLLNDQGIFVKNELYFEKVSEIFPHALQLNYYDVPLICKQCLAFGSFGTDFLLQRNNLSQHEDVETLFEPLEELDAKMNYVHDYNNNPNIRRLGDDTQECTATDQEQEKQVHSPGIVLILDAEVDNAETIASSDALVQRLTSALQQAGLVVLSDVKPKDGDETAILMLEQGYAVARGWPENEYCAVDVHLWSAFETMETVQRNIMTALGASESSSSFRIVAGGMFGVSTWQDDATRRGPQLNKNCDVSDDSKAGATAVETETKATVSEDSKPSLSENIASGDDMIRRNFVEAVLVESLLQWRPAAGTLTVAVLCGQDTEYCHSLNVMEKHASTQKVIALWTCPDLVQSGDEEKTFDDMDERQFRCEMELLSTMEVAVGNQTKINTVVLDPSAPLAMGQMAHSIFRSNRQRKTLLTSMDTLDILALAPAVGTDLEQEERDNGRDELSWRRIFVDQFRPFFPREPSFEAHVEFKTGQKDDEQVVATSSVFCSGDSQFIPHLEEVNARIALSSKEWKTGAEDEPAAWNPKVVHIGSVELQYHEDFEASHFFTNQDYDQRSPFEQWKSQHPLGYQTIFQMELQQGADDKRVTRDLVQSRLNEALKAVEAELSLPPREFGNLGDGSVVVSTFSSSEIGGGMVVLLWDGRTHVDLNLFLYREPGDAEFAKPFLRPFTLSAEQVKFKVVLRDEMPRGFGRVVNFWSDLEPQQDEPRPVPKWAEHLT